jgi:predicted pyridoxine 5'-phosphate oxidase superfamily flavin-nucleotide-binding protein
MTTPTVELHEGFSEPGATAVPWTDVEQVLSTSEMYFLSTVRADGRPHVTPLPAIWDRGTLHICTGDQEQKARNLARQPACVLSTGTNRLHGGLDVVAEGVAVRVTEPARLRELAALWKSRLDWDFEVGEDAFRDADGRTGLVYAIRPRKVLAFGKGPYTQTRYRFPGADDLPSAENRA